MSNLGNCPILHNCKKASNINCADRNHATCDLFKNLLKWYCEAKARNKCGFCRYYGECDRPTKRRKQP